MVHPSTGSAAFFDLDLTLLGINSAKHWLTHEHRDGRISHLQLAEAAVWLLGYKLGVLDVERGIRRATAGMRGQLEVEVEARTGEWYRRHIAGMFLPAGRDAVEAHRHLGHPVVLLTSTSLYVSRLVQRDLNLDDILCTRFEVKEGRFTGTPILPVCYGRGKVRLASIWADTHGVSLAECHFYSDSFSDLPMLEAVGYPHAVNPDPRLRREATRRNWPIHQWRISSRGAGSRGKPLPKDLE